MPEPTPEKPNKEIRLGLPYSRVFAGELTRRMSNIWDMDPKELARGAKRWGWIAVGHPAVHGQGGRLAGWMVSHWEGSTSLILASRQSRIDTDARSPKDGCIYAVTHTGVEMIPVVGDILSITEGAFGREIGGRYLDKIDRAIYLVAGLIPVVPDLPARAIVRNIRVSVEEEVARRYQASLELPPQA